MSEKVRQSRYNFVLESNFEKIIDNGIKYNLKRLDQTSHNIKKFRANNNQNNLMREHMNARLIIQQLTRNLNELEKCYFILKENDLDKKYDNVVESIKKEVFERINSYRKTNNQIYESFQEDSSEENNQDNEINLQIQNEACKLTDSKQRMIDVEKLNEDLKELNTLVTQFASIVEEQGTKVDTIESNIISTQMNVKTGTNSLIKASASSIAPLTCAAVGGVIFGPIGAIVGLKLSTGIASAFSASVLSYSFAKYVEKKNEKKSTIELDELSKTQS